MCTARRGLLDRRWCDRRERPRAARSLLWEYDRAMATWKLMAADFVASAELAR
jgi:hypothetical protein